MGKFSLPASILPVFVLAALFKLDSFAITYVWDERACLLLILLSNGPGLKVFLPLKDLTVASISQGVNVQSLILHLSGTIAS